MKLSILIATTSVRDEIIRPLLQNLVYQCKDLHSIVEVIIDNHETNIVGVKRNNLLNQAIGDYVIFVDSDDKISPLYIEKILKATETNPDCIGISGTITFNGGPHKQWHISKEYGSWYQKGDVYYRTPNHISPVRRELALQAGFPEISFGEDAEYSKNLLSLLKTEVVIPGNLYHYDFWHVKR